MDDGQHDAAWQRIEAALARLDTAAGTLGARQAARQAADERSLRAEQARHGALRDALRETLGRIDTLIATHSSDTSGNNA
jgi:ferric-dicitrate binding protein FerR (iron transport regulator)